MSWASRRRATYAGAIFLIFVGAAIVPVINYIKRPATCFDGSRNQGETATDKGGPCQILDENSLSPSTVLWARSFQVRDGSYSAVAYIENPNPSAGVRRANYHMSFYDNKNIIIAERYGETAIMPGAITPIFEGGITTGNREVSRTYVEIEPSLIWERLENPAAALRIQNRIITNEESAPRLEASVENTATRPLTDMSFVAVIFSPASNARAASRTSLARIESDESTQIIFTWPEPFPTDVGRIDILPLMQPALTKGR